MRPPSGDTRPRHHNLQHVYVERAKPAWSGGASAPRSKRSDETKRTEEIISRIEVGPSARLPQYHADKAERRGTFFLLYVSVYIKAIAD